MEASGRKMSDAETEFTESFATEVRATVEPETWASAWLEGQRMTVDQVIGLALGEPAPAEDPNPR